MTSLKRETQAAYLLDLLHSPRPLGAYELLERARAKGIVSPTIVYCALERLLESGAIYRVPSLKAFAAFREEARGANFSNIRQICFAVCDGCGMTNWNILLRQGIFQSASSSPVSSPSK